MKAKKKPLDTLTPEQLSVSVQSHVSQMGVTPPPERAAGIKVEDVSPTGRQTEKRSEGDLMKTLVIAEHDNASLKVATLNAVAAAGALGGDVDILVAGAGAPLLPTRLRRCQGVVSKVVCADNAAYEHQLAENVSLLIAELGAITIIAGPSTANGKNIMPRVAALLDVGQISDILSVESADTFKRPIYAGNVIATVQSLRCQKGDHRSHHGL
jgi:electron transfer flavoprotein alpha/beta subunit